jgi:acetyl-CoA acyltransferase
MPVMTSSTSSGRNAWLQAGLPVETPATTIDRQCGSVQQAVNLAAALIAAGVHDVVIGSGVEHMGHIPMGVGFNWMDEVGSPWPSELVERYNLIPQGLSAELIADQWEIPRSELDELAQRSRWRSITRSVAAAPAYRRWSNPQPSCSVGRMRSSLIAMCRARVTM